jgi:hypothetical protein
MYVPESVDSVIRTLSPSIAPPDTWLVGSIAKTAGFKPDFFNLVEILSINDDFPAPAGPVIPITIDFPDVLNIFLINFLDSFSSFSKIEIAFAFLNQKLCPSTIIFCFCDKYWLSFTFRLH